MGNKDVSDIVKWRENIGKAGKRNIVKIIHASGRTWILSVS